MSSHQPPRVIIVGAGWSGLAAAKTYLEIRPDISLTIIDEDSSVGGVWSGSRVYPGLIADSCAAIFDYSDFPMDEELGLDKWADLPAGKVHEYFERYIDRFDLRSRCRLNTKVLRIEREAGSEKVSSTWKVEVETKSGSDTAIREILVCDKLIIATGLDSTPNLPGDINWTNFTGPIMHSKEVGTKHHLLTSEAVKRVTVVGGNKSAVDAVNLCALAGKEVDWVIRKEGYGPGILFQPRTHGIHVGAIKAMRATTLLAPNPLSMSGFWYWFLHSGKSKVGSWLVKSALRQMSEGAMKDYERSENTMRIAPDVKDLVWSNSGVSVVHDGSTFMDMVDEGKLIHVHRASVTSLSSGQVHLSDGQILPCDATVFATGWKMNQSRIFESKLLSDIGFALPLSQESPEQEKHWANLVQGSETQIRTSFPMLANLPPEIIAYDKEHAPPATDTPFRLFRGIAPPNLAARGDRSLIVLGLLINTNVPTYAEVSSLWGVAYLENLPFAQSASEMLSSVPKMEKDISLLQAWSNLRFRNPAMHVLDGSEIIQNFTDVLMRDLGLNAERKKQAAGPWWLGGGVVGSVKEWFAPYRGLDYKGFVREYLKRWSERLSHS